MRKATALILALLLGSCQYVNLEMPGSVERSARSQPQTTMEIYAPEQHELYDGRFNILARDIYQAGTLNDASPWDHMDNAGENLRQVSGLIIIDVDERANSGTFSAVMEVPEGEYRVDLERFHEFSPCQDGGIAAYLYEHGNAGCGDSNWPKSLLFVAGWGYGKATLNGETLYEDFEIHFMVTQGMRDRDTFAVKLNPESGEAGSVNPATQQVDFYIRSPERNENNHPDREVFDHFFAMEVTWK